MPVPCNRLSGPPDRFQLEAPHYVRLVHVLPSGSRTGAITDSNRPLPVLLFPRRPDSLRPVARHPILHDPGSYPYVGVPLPGRISRWSLAGGSDLPADSPVLHSRNRLPAIHPAFGDDEGIAKNRPVPDHVPAFYFHAVCTIFCS